MTRENSPSTFVGLAMAATFIAFAHSAECRCKSSRSSVEGEGLGSPCCPRLRTRAATRQQCRWLTAHTDHLGNLRTQRPVRESCNQPEQIWPERFHSAENCR